MSHDEATYRATAGMLGSASLPMQEPEEVVSPEQELLTLKLRLMAEQVECERLRNKARKAKNAMRKRQVYHSGKRKQSHRISMSARLDDARELIAWMEIAVRTTLKAPPKGVIKFRQALAKRLAKP